ncbi:DUF3360 family protein [Dendrosporobacter sp. 1207_IL3150]|uniref:DUF3360 family protein n=1 Tax=Dendrosporobacter sp. 1207_IL3150 TaxID=3084054 RepID=UPI002FDA713B
MRKDLLEKDLLSYNPKRWRINIPFKDYSFKVEDFVPALSGAIGKVAIVAAFAVAWSKGFGITDPSFVTENVRLEIVLGSILTLILCAFLNPYAGPPGTLAPLIPIIPLMVVSGVHPLPLGIMIGLIGLVIASFNWFSKIVQINGTGTKGGVILLFGFMGITSSLDTLRSWSIIQGSPDIFTILIVAGVVLFLILNKLKLRWLIIPICAAAALVISASFGIYPAFKTGAGLPTIDASLWWNEKWGIGWGLSASNFISALPFAILAVVMWPIDAVAIKTIQENNYPKEAKKAVFDMNDTYLIVALRNIIGVVLGGGQVAAVWRSFMIPLGMVKRPIGASAFLLGVVGIAFGLLGFPIDIAVFPPLLGLVLIFGVYLPLVEVGLDTIKSTAEIQIAAVCFIIGIAVNPVIGWIAAVLIENFKLISASECTRTLTRQEKLITASLAGITLSTFFMASV